ncbi:MAG: hypothetical protein CMJ64_15425 [Planctomycetaceae bacterium]|nr:hypothetical protein [Planctomycetaceae bacterium]
MAKTDKKSKDHVSSALATLRDELRQDVLGIAESVEQLKASTESNGSGNDRAAIANSLQALRQELRHEVSSLSQQIEQAQLEQAQSMLVTPEADTTELTSAVSSLREELNQNVRGLANSIEQLTASAASMEMAGDSGAVADSIQTLREELHSEASRFNERIEQAHLEQSNRQAVAPVVDTSEFSDAVQHLRGELRRDVQNLSQTIACNEPQPKGSPVLTTIAMLASLATGAFGMAFYQQLNQDDTSSQALNALSGQIEAISNSETGSLKKNADRLEELIAAQLTDSTSSQQAIERLNETVVGLQDAMKAQDERLEQGMASIAESLASEVAKIVASEVTTVAKPPAEASSAGDTPEDEPDEEKPASEAKAGADEAPESSEAEATAQAEVEADGGVGEDDPVALDPPPEEPLEKVENVVRSPVQAKLIIDNSSRVDIKLKINGEEVEVAARGVTTVPVTQGAVKTEIGSYAQEWDDWEVVDGEPRLKIKVESGADYYKLR